MLKPTQWLLLFCPFSRWTFCIFCIPHWIYSTQLLSQHWHWCQIVPTPFKICYRKKNVNHHHGHRRRCRCHRRHLHHSDMGGNISKILNAFFASGYDKRVRPNYGGKLDQFQMVQLSQDFLVQFISSIIIITIIILSHSVIFRYYQERISPWLFDKLLLASFHTHSSGNCNKDIIDF